MKMESYYDILGCSPNASYGEIKKRYHALIKLHHPDMSSGIRNSYFHTIQEAWETLRDCEKRKLYNENLERRQIDSEVMLYGSFILSDLQFDPLKKIYSCDCRCGGSYEFVRDDCEEFHSYLISCDQCSLMISVFP